MHVEMSGDTLADQIIRSEGVKDSTKKGSSATFKLTARYKRCVTAESLRWNYRRYQAPLVRVAGDSSVCYSEKVTIRRTLIVGARAGTALPFSLIDPKTGFGELIIKM